VYSGAATNAKSQKFGLRNAMMVNANHTLRRRKKSLSALNRRAIGLANRNIAMAIARTTINSLTL
jgi:hypothetical protein